MHRDTVNHSPDSPARKRGPSATNRRASASGSGFPLATLGGATLIENTNKLMSRAALSMPATQRHCSNGVAMIASTERKSCNRSCKEHKPFAVDLVLSPERVRYMQDLNVSLGVQKSVLPFERVCDMSLARDAVKLLG